MFAAMVLLVIVLLYSLSTKDFALIPADEDHLRITEEKMCLSCHAVDRENPLNEEHPPKDQCLECHERAEKND